MRMYECKDCGTPVSQWDVRGERCPACWEAGREARDAAIQARLAKAEEYRKTLPRLPERLWGEGEDRTKD